MCAAPASFSVLIATILLATYSLLCTPSRLVLSGVQVITKQIDGHKCEPYEEAVIEVPEEHVGPVVDMLGQRKGQMLDLVAGESGGLTRSHPPFTPLAAPVTACASLDLHHWAHTVDSTSSTEPGSLLCHADFCIYRLTALKHCRCLNEAAKLIVLAVFIGRSKSLQLVFSSHPAVGHRPVAE